MDKQNAEEEKGREINAVKETNREKDVTKIGLECNQESATS